MKTFKKIVLAILAVLPAIYTAAAVLFFLPDTVAAHFGLSGDPDRYGSKYEAFILVGIILIIYLFYLLMRRFTMRSSTDENDRTARNLDSLDTVMICIFVLLNSLCIFCLTAMKEPSLLKDVDHVLYLIEPTIIGVTFIVIGNLMPKTKRNSFMGMRMKFATDTDEHWYIANRDGGIAMVLSGLVTVAAGLILRSSLFIFVMMIALAVFLTLAIIHSYVKIMGENKR